MPGTIDDPVRLDPFQNIVEVGWRNDPPTHVAVAIGITTWVHWISAAGSFCEATGSREAEEGIFYDDSWLTSFEFQQSQPTLIGAYRPDLANKWLSDAGGSSAVIEGVPNVDGSESVAPITWAGPFPGLTVSNQEVLGGGNYRVRHFPLVVHELYCRMEWEALTGSPILDSNGAAILSPAGSVPFVALTSAALLALGLALEENELICTVTPPFDVPEPTALTLVRMFPDSTHTGWVESAGTSGVEILRRDLDASGLTVTMGANIYRAVGMAVPLSGSANPILQNTGTIYVLCALDEPTP